MFSVSLIVLCCLCVAVAGLLVFLADRVLNRADEQRALTAAAERRAIELTHAALREGPDKKLIELLEHHLNLSADLTKQAVDAAMAISEDFRTIKRMRLETDIAATQYVNAQARYAGNNGAAPKAPPPGARDGEIVDELPRGTI